MDIEKIKYFKSELIKCVHKKYDALGFNSNVNIEIDENEYININIQYLMLAQMKVWDYVNYKFTIHYDDTLKLCLLKYQHYYLTENFCENLIFSQNDLDNINEIIKLAEVILNK